MSPDPKQIGTLLTLIFAARSEGMMLLGSDTLLTLEKGESQTPQILPTLAYFRNGDRETPKHLSALCTKIIRISKKCTLLWYGSPLIARSVGSRIKELISKDKYFDLNHAINSLELSLEEKESVGIILAHSKGWDAELEVHGHFRNEVRNNIEYLIGGSGEWDFFDEQHPGVSSSTDIDENPINRLTGELYSRIGRTLIKEGYNPDHIHYGAWFDIAMATPLGFKFMDYCVRVWTWDGNRIYSNEPILFSYYESNRLYICSFYENSFNIFPVPCAMDRKEIQKLPSDGKYNPYFQIHCIIDQENDRLYIQTLNGKSDALSIEINKKKISINTSTNYINWMQGNISKLKLNQPISPYK